MSLVFCGDEERLLTGGEDYTAALWDVTKAKLIHRFDKPGDWIVEVASSRHGGILATGDYDRDPSFRLWHSGSLAQRAILRGPTLGVSGVAIFGDGSRWSRSGSTAR